MQRRGVEEQVATFWSTGLAALLKADVSTDHTAAAAGVDTERRSFDDITGA
jgi:hypothetical protein